MSLSSNQGSTTGRSGRTSGRRRTDDDITNKSVPDAPITSRAGGALHPLDKPRTGLSCSQMDASALIDDHLRLSPRCPSPVTTLGERAIDGIETGGYRLMVPATARMYAGAEPSLRSLLGQELATTKYLRMEVWSDSCGLPVELDDTVDYRTPSPPTLLSETVREDLRYSEATLRIKVPLSSEVLVVPSLQAVDQC